ncbi:TPA: hypothetical protein TVL20_001699, partial [Streptococcus equi subsp. zooepidemicus]|nr:hypothetical protein [Streptococcus equi subsp. zooepidemicus]
MSITDSSYRKLAEQVYNVEPSKAKFNEKKKIVEGRLVTDNNTGKQYRVLL